MEDTSISIFMSSLNEFNEEISNFSRSNDFFRSRKMSFESENEIFNKKVDSFEVIRKNNGQTSLKIDNKTLLKSNNKGNNKEIIIKDKYFQSSSIESKKKNERKSKISDEANRLAVKRYRERQKSTINELIIENNNLKDMLNEKYDSVLLSFFSEPKDNVVGFLNNLRKKARKMNENNENKEKIMDLDEKIDVILEFFE